MTTIQATQGKEWELLKTLECGLWVEYQAAETRGVISTRDITPLEVVQYDGKLLSLSNRRLAALKMYQALHGNDVVWVPCILRNEQSPRFDHAYSTLSDNHISSRRNFLRRWMSPVMRCMLSV